MLESIVQGALQGALFGAIGGAFGTLVVWAIEKVAKRKPKWTAILPIICAVGAVFLERYLRADPHEAVLVELDKLPTVSALKIHYPEDYAKLGAILNSMPSGASAIDVQNSTRPIISKVVERQMPKASAENAFDVLQLAHDESLALRSVSPAACVALASGGAPQVDLASAFGPDLMKRDFDVTARTLVQTAVDAQAPAKPLDESVASEIALAGLNAMSEADRNLAVPLLQASKPPVSEAENVALCNFYLASFKTLLSEPNAVAGQKIRSLLATK